MLLVVTEYFPLSCFLHEEGCLIWLEDNPALRESRSHLRMRKKWAAGKAGRRESGKSVPSNPRGLWKEEGPVGERSECSDLCPDHWTPGQSLGGREEGLVDWEGCQKTSIVFLPPVWDPGRIPPVQGSPRQYGMAPGQQRGSNSVVR